MKSSFIFKHTIFLLWLSFLQLSCSIDSSYFVREPSLKPCLSSLRVINPVTGDTVTGEIFSDSSIVLYLPKTDKVDSLEFFIDGIFTKVLFENCEYNELSCRMGGVINLENPHRMKLYNDAGDSCFYDVYVSNYNCIPQLFLNTEGKKTINSKTNWINADIDIKNALWYNMKKKMTCKVKGRGNASWTHLKKPYIIKLQEKYSVLGMPKNKKWILLAENYDYSLLRTAFMCECAKALDVDYVFRYEYVELFINEEYFGTYLLAEKVENKEGRVEVENDGFILEEDNWYAEEPCYFSVDSLLFHFSFKYPDSGNGDIRYGDDSFLFITDYMNRMTDSVLQLMNDVNSQDYLDYIDLESFAKWYIAMEVTGNRDPNRYYVLKNRESKLKMYPVWDAEWSMGIQPPTAWGEPPSVYYNQEIWKNLQFFPYLFRSKLFVNEVKKQWLLFKSKIPEVKADINIIKNKIKHTQEDNFIRWDKNPIYRPSVYFESWEEEVNYVENFFDNRVLWLDNYIGNNE